MLTSFLVLLSVVLVKSQVANFATPMLLNVKDMSGAAEFGDEEHRGPKWRDQSTDTSKASDEDTSKSSTSSSLEYTDGRSETASSTSSEGSSVYTKEKNKGRKKKRECQECSKDMLKSWKNINIRWICAGYQRARRSFKSLCMMRYRNCQDGTMFVKLHDLRCKNDTYHGRHWFYVYKTY